MGILNLLKRRSALDDNNLALLSLFLKPRQLDTPTWQGIWTQCLGRPYPRAIEDFIRQGLLAEADVAGKLEYLRVVDLKPILKDHGLKVTGRKEELITRLMENVPEEMKILAEKMRDVYVCSPKGIALAGPWKEAVDARRADVEGKVRGLVERRKFHQAAKAINDFFDTVPSPISGAGIFRSNPGPVEEMSKIKHRDGFSDEELQAAKTEAMLLVLWGKKIPTSNPLGSFLQDSALNAMRKANIQNYKQNSDIVKGIEILAAQDACPVCKAMHGKRILLKHIRDELIPPYHEGCRCAVLPVVKTFAELGIKGIEEPEQGTGGEWIR